MHPLIEKLHELKKSLEVEGADAFTINLEIATVTEQLRYELALAGRERPRTKKRTLKEINGALRYTSGRGEAIAKAFERKRGESKAMKINIGDKFVPRSKGPWPKTEPVGTVIDIKDGWVRYNLGGLVTDLQEPLDNFLKLFSLLP